MLNLVADRTVRIGFSPEFISIDSLRPWWLVNANFFMLQRKYIDQICNLDSI